MTQLAPHLDDIEEAKRECVQLVTGDVADVIAYIQAHYPQFRVDPRSLLQVHCGLDSRLGWDAWLIKLRNHSIAWTDGPIDGMQRLDVVGGKRG